MKKHIIINLIFLFIISSGIEGITYGGPGNDHGYKVIQTSDHGFALLGEYYGNAIDIYLVKLDSLAHIEWSFTYTNNLFQDEYANDITQTADGGYLILGTHMNSSNNLRAWLLRLNSFGDTLWTRTYNDDPQFEDAGAFVEVYSPGRYTIAINSVGLTGSNFLYMCRTDTSGNIADTLSITPAYGKVLPIQDGYLMTSTKNSFPPPFLNLFRTDTGGAAIFNKDYFDSNFSRSLNGNSSAICGSGFLTAGSTNLYTVSAGEYEFYLLRTNANGDSIWTKHWGNSISALTYIIHDNYSGYYMAGNTDSSGFKKDFIFKTDSLGNIIWSKYIGINLSISSLTMTNSGDIVVIGDSLDPVAGTNDLWLLFYDSLGNPLNNPSTGFIDNIFTNDMAVNAWPNPAKDHINIDCGNYYSAIDGYTLRIDNSLGKILYSKYINRQFYTVDLNSWPETEIYFLRLINKEGRTVEVKKIMKY